MSDFKTSSTYVASEDLLVAVQAALALERPLLVKGEPGTGKTVLAEEIAAHLGQPLVRWHIKSTSTAQQGLYDYDAVARLRDGQLGSERVHDIANYIVKGKLWEVFESDGGAVLLIDEIDKADIEFPNDLLLELDRMEFFVYETKQTIRAARRPAVIITSNNEKELPDAFLRRCFFHFIRFPEPETMVRILQSHYPDLQKELLNASLSVFYGMREVPGLKKRPSTSELLDWMRLLLLERIQASDLSKISSSGEIPPFLGSMVKNEADLQRIAEHLGQRANRRHPVGMFVHLFYELRAGGVPVNSQELLTLLDVLRAELPEFQVERFYYLARATLVKDERYFDRFDRVFSGWLEGIEAIEDPFTEIPDEWLGDFAEKHLTEEQKAQIKEMGSWRELLDELRRRLEEQKERHQGGSKWIGTGGTSPFGAYGYNPAGIRVGQDRSRHQRAVKVWDRREFRDHDDRVELGTRQMKMALRRLRRFTREGARLELDLPGTIKATARNAGHLQLSMHPERQNQVKVLLFLDVGGSMDMHVETVAQLFSAARSEFKHLEYLYFHNCPYERLWRDNSRRFEETISTAEVLRTYPSDYRIIFVGDASMSPTELVYEGGSVEHWNEEPGTQWMTRLIRTWERAVWINPTPEQWWPHTHSIGMIQQLMAGRMVPLTLEGLEQGIRTLQA